MRITLRQAFTTLGVAQGASEDEARTAYRKLALQFHPDKNPHADATAKFQEISAAYKKVCDFHKRGGNQSAFFFDDDDDDDSADHPYGHGDEDFGFDGMDFDDLEPTFEEMLMMFEMMFGPTMPSSKNKNKKNKKKMAAANKKKSNDEAATTATAAPSVDGSVSDTSAAEPTPKVTVPLGGGKARRRKAPLGKQRGRNGLGGLDDPFAGFMDPEMMMFEQFMGMSMNDPDLNAMEGDLMEEMMHLFAGASDDDLFDLVGGGRGRGKARGSKSKAKKAATTTRVDSSEEEVEEVSDWEDDGGEEKLASADATKEDGGNQGDEKRESESITIDSRVRVHGKLPGTVKFVGPVHYSKGEFIGVELDVAEGKNDGTLKGVSYFTCKPRHGVMVRPEDVTLEASSNR